MGGAIEAHCERGVKGCLQSAGALTSRRCGTSNQAAEQAGAVPPSPSRSLRQNKQRIVGMQMQMQYCSDGRVAGRLAGWQGGRLAGWQAGRLAGW
jgi:hypothetical protein